MCKTRLFPGHGFRSSGINMSLKILALLSWRRYATGLWTLMACWLADLAVALTFSITGAWSLKFDTTPWLAFVTNAGCGGEVVGLEDITNLSGGGPGDVSKWNMKYACFILVSSFDGLVIVARVVYFLMVCVSVFSNHCLSVQSLLQDRPICLASKTLGFPSWTGGFTVLALPLQPQTLCFNKQAATFLPVGLWQHFMHNLHTVILYFDWH